MGSSLFKKLAHFANSPQGKRAIQQAKKMANDPKNKQKIDQVKSRFFGKK